MKSVRMTEHEAPLHIGLTFASSDDKCVPYGSMDQTWIKHGNRV